MTAKARDQGAAVECSGHPQEPLPKARGAIGQVQQMLRQPQRASALDPCADSLQPIYMGSPVIVSIPHQLGRAEARRRIEGGFAKIVNLLPGSSGTVSERWDGDRLIFNVATLGQTVSGVIQVHDTTVVMEMELPVVLRVIASGLRQRLQKMGQRLLTRR